jgi:molecular chaperone GrpE (heat shock protein)
VRARQDARAQGDGCKKELLRVVKSFVEAVDGIDGGLRNEAEVRGRLQAFEAEYGSLIDFWFAAYHNLEKQIDKFFSATGIGALSVAPGTPFDPATMEPVGTVANPDLNNEDVAMVLRRGYMIHGEQVRPMMVEVVINK